MYNKKILYLRSLSIKCVSWQIFTDIIENQDLYRNKTTSEKKLKNPKIIFFNVIELILYQYICKMFILADIE